MSRGGEVWTLDNGGNRFDRAIEWVLVGLLAFMPLAFGVAEAWSEEVVMMLVAGVCVCFFLKIVWTREVRIVRTWAYLPILAFVLVALIQLAPLPVAWVRLLSPQTVVQKTQLLGDIRDAGATISGMSISFYPYATWHDLRMILAGAALFAVVLNVFRTPEQIVRLSWAIAIIGAGVAVLALVHGVLGNGRIYWVVQSPQGTGFAGPFVNHSHYAQFMNLSAGAALGVILVRLHQRFAGHSVLPATVMEYLGSSEGKRTIGLSLAVILGLASIFLSLSRGGMISMAVAGAFTIVIVSWKKSLRGAGWVMVLMALGAFVCVLYVGFEAVYDRLETLAELDRAEGGRWQILKDIATAWTSFPILGTGLGTHEVVYPMFDRSTTPALATHAENEYAQAAEETGIVGLLALAAFGVLVWRSYVRVVRTPHVPIHSMAYGLGFGLLAIMIHSLSDFGQHLPANAFLSVVFCALLIRLEHIRPDLNATVGETSLTGRRRWWYGIVGLVCSCVLSGAVLYSCDAARRAETCWARVTQAEGDMAKINWHGTDEQYAYLLKNAAQAQEYQPSSITYRHWLNVYRWRAISRPVDPNAGEATLPPEGTKFVVRVIDELKTAIGLCPTYGSTWTVLGQLERLVTPQSDEGARHILRGRQLAPCNATACVVSGMLYAERSDVDAAFADWQRAAQLNGRVFPEVCSSLVTLGRADLACMLAGDDTDRLIHVERSLSESGASVELVGEVSYQIQRLLEKECQGTDVPAWKFVWLAQRYRQKGNMREAVRMYRKALALEYGQVSWRFDLAQILAEQGLVSEATNESELCLRLRPQFEPALRLLEHLSVRASVGEGPRR